MNTKNPEINQIDIWMTEDELIEKALTIIQRRLSPGQALCSPDDVKKFLSLKLAQRNQEVFVCIYLDNKNQVIDYEELFYGTIDQVSVYPRVIVQKCLQNHSSALIVAHNHPSSSCQESAADVEITKRLKDSLALVDVRLLDHFIVGGSNVRSLAESGLL